MIVELLATKGLRVETLSPTDTSIMRTTLVVDAMNYLIGSDFATQDIAGRVIDARFETLTTKFDALSSRDRDAQDRSQWDLFGWVFSRRLKYESSRVDELSQLVSIASSCGALQVSPTDATMNALRLYDLLTTCGLSLSDPSGNFLTQDSGDRQSTWFRYKLIKFICHWNGWFDDSNGRIDDATATAIVHMPMYQLIPVVMSAFRRFERRVVPADIKVAFPVLEPRLWSEELIPELLSVRLHQTVEWWKFYPLLCDEDTMEYDGHLTFEDAYILIPEELDTLPNDSMGFTFRRQRFLPFLTAHNHSIFGAQSFLDYLKAGLLPSMWVSEQTEDYLMSYRVSYEGYMLTGIQHEGEFDQTLIYHDRVKPVLTEVSEVSKIRDKQLLLYPDADIKKILRGFEDVSSALESAEKVITSLILNFTSRKIVGAATLRRDDRLLPMFYSFSGRSGFQFTNG